MKADEAPKETPPAQGWRRFFINGDRFKLRRPSLDWYIGFSRTMGLMHIREQTVGKSRIDG
jgi:hypothetical protein